MNTIVIGGGMGGYVAAIRLAQLGANVTLIEKKHIGGTCLNEGCIPTKVLLHTTETLNKLETEAEEIGICIDNIKVDWIKLQERKSLIVEQLVNGIKTILNSHKIEVIIGEAYFINDDQIQITKQDGTKFKMKFDKAIIAVGSKPASIPIPGIDNHNIITSTEALSLQEIPESLAIIGGGVIGCEFASIYSSLGSKITIIEMLPNIIPNMDSDIVNILKSKLEEKGIKIHTNSKVTKINDLGKETELIVELANGEKTSLLAHKILLSTGRSPSTENLGLENTTIKTDKGFIQIDKNMQTTNKNIYAVGDCNGGALLAHVAAAEGMFSAEFIMNKSPKIDFKTTPFCVYTSPEIAGVGMTEQQANDNGYKIKTSIFPLYANAKSIIVGESEGIVKFVTEKYTGEILGLHIIGSRATDLIMQGSLAIRLEATIDEIITTIYAHPTVSEAISEAAHGVYGNAIHLPV